MKAVQYTPSGELRWVTVDKPSASGHDLLVRVMAVSVNPVDVKQPKPNADAPPRILGYDVAGIVEEVGEDVTLFKPGDAVFYAGSIDRPGGFSEYHLVDERIVGPKPERLSFAEAAAMPLTTITAWEGLFDRLHIPREGAKGTILVIGAAGGVGSIAVQLAKWAGLTVIGTASRPDSQNWVKDLGADAVISHFQPVAAQLKNIGHDSVNYIFCLNQVAPHWDGMVEVLAPEGAICTILPPGPVDVNPLWAGSGTLAAESMFTRPRFHTAAMIEQHRLLTRVSALLDEGVLTTTLKTRYTPISPKTLSQAFEQIKTGHTVGKIVVEEF
ncbi:zinc-binding alcohol dehydrogenase family protein [Sulfobacillus harzensis]|uniref:Zinc-type alcohol dehydrogenase-like protein n=1 Tax=Sulfobacillus harzensis TaxID=2729629 RepID=A0A7Y0L6G8_9FIRM|nr:zinc-binding alcohol dehydrogenase family protein [Sulfobacillus harzensis]NMP24162.1 zinc-binding alcohol dehydrogenase family protein [Sulfobacillus harzensis]